MFTKKLPFKMALLLILAAVFTYSYSIKSYSQSLNPYGKGKIRYTVNMPNVEGSITLSAQTLLGDVITIQPILIRLPRDNGKTFTIHGTAADSSYLIKEVGLDLVSLDNPNIVNSHEKERFVKTDANGNGQFPMPSTTGTQSGSPSP